MEKASKVYFVFSWITNRIYCTCTYSSILYSEKQKGRLNDIGTMPRNNHACYFCNHVIRIERDSSSYVPDVCFASVYHTNTTLDTYAILSQFGPPRHVDCLDPLLEYRSEVSFLKIQQYIAN